MRRAVLRVALLALLVGPTALAFFSGGYFDGPRAWAGLLAWAIVAVAALAGGAVPHGRAAWLAVGGLAAFAALSLASTMWAPVAGNAYHAAQIAALYLGMLLAGAMLLTRSGAGAQRLIEPVLAAGTMVVIGYALSERFLPGLLHFARSVSAEGRLEQPLTYWNATGELAAIGFVLCARLAGDRGRPPWLRIAAAAAIAPLGLGLYVSFSRGALFACAAGLVALAASAPRREQLRAVGLAVGAGVLGAVAGAPFAAVTSLQGSLATRESQGAIALILVAVVGAVAGAVQWRSIRRGREGDARLPRAAPLIAAAVICAGLGLAIVVGSKESSGASQPLSNGANRLITLKSNRYAYWSVALRAFGTEPLRGVGAGNWSIDWLRWRKIPEFAQDAHSLPLQTLAELGLIGLAALAAFLAGVALAARAALRVSPLAAGPIAALVTYLVHAPLDWDWEMPAVTLVAMALAGLLLALARPSPAPLIDVRLSSETPPDRAQEAAV